MAEVGSEAGAGSGIRSGRMRARLTETWKGAAVAARSNRGLVTLALLLAMMVTAIEQTVVSTAMPTIISSLHGLDIYPWVFSAYLLASTVSTPLYGKLADLLGRKRVLLFGLGLFGLGSMMSGLAQSMPQLIAMRVLQGLGAGAVGPIVITLLGDLFTLKERARVQGLFSVVWGGSSLAGPWVGGRITDLLSWRWVFFVTVPFAAFSAWILITQVHETVKRREVLPIDWSGAGLLTVGSTTMLLGVLHGGTHGWRTGAALIALSMGLLFLFIRREGRAADPVLPLDLFLKSHTAAPILGGFVIGTLVFGLDTYVPLFVQGVKGRDATVAGQTITPLFLTWALSAFLAAWVVGRLGYRKTAVAGSLLATFGTLALVYGAVHPSQSRSFFMGGMLLVGLGMGPTSLTHILSVQNAVPWERRGAATAAVMFVRTMSGALMVGVLGASLGHGLAVRLSNVPAAEIAAALRPETHARLSPAMLSAVQGALGLSLRDVYLEMSVVAAMGVICSFGLRGGRTSSHRDAEMGTGRVGRDDVVGLALGAEA